MFLLLQLLQRIRISAYDSAHAHTDVANTHHREVEQHDFAWREGERARDCVCERERERERDRARREQARWGGREGEGSLLICLSCAEDAQPCHHSRCVRGSHLNLALLFPFRV